MKKLEAEQRRKSLRAEKRKLEAQKALMEAEELESMVSMKSMSRTSQSKSTTQAKMDPPIFGASVQERI